MDIVMTVWLALMGLGAVVAGAVGVALPAGERLSAGLALLIGAGVGVVTLAVGAQFVDETNAEFNRLFLTASILGFAATLAGLAVLWRVTR